MEKLTATLFLSVLLSCSAEKKQEVTEDADKRFPTCQFDLSEYNKKVSAFLKEHLSTEELAKTDRFIFLTTRSCANCSMDAFEALGPYFSTTAASHIIFVSDSTLLTGRAHRKNSTFRYFPRETFEHEHVFHGRPYLYYFKNGDIQEIELSGKQIDSLNER